MPPNIRIVLVEPSHPGNIGAVARAMKNMALEELVLVRPKLFPHAEATARASGADDVLARARVVGCVAEAIADCGFVAATTSRERDQNFRVMELRAAAERIVQESGRAPAAVLFGAERTGLRNSELDSAHLLIRIPANPAYASLNLAMAAQLVAYELFRARSGPLERPAGEVPLASPQEMDRLYVHLAQVLEEIDFRDRTQSGTHLLARIRRFLQRAELDQNESNILRGILTAVQRRRRHAGQAAPASGMRPVYLDHAATTPLDPAVAQTMAVCLAPGADFGNPSSATHAFGLRAALRIERSRAQVATLLGAHCDEIVFTSGATESSNLAILGVARGNADRGRHLITSRIEHRAVLDPCRHLEREGFSVTYVTPERSGRIEPRAVFAAVQPGTVLVSIMHANNEIGVIQDIAAIGAWCRERSIAFHSDAAQTVGKLPIDVRELPVDFLSFTAHKLYGPKGVGALYVRRGARALLQPILFGGGQERSLRPGTLPTHQIAGFGTACELAARELAGQALRSALLRERLWEGIRAAGGVHLNGEGAPRLPGILNVSFEGVEGESLVTALAGLAVSTGSACSSANAEPSYVLRALGRDAQLAQSSLRFSFGRFTSEAEVAHAADAVCRELRRLRCVSPAWTGANQAGEPAVQGRASESDYPTLSPLARGLFLALPGAGRFDPEHFPRASVISGEAGGPGQETWCRFHLHIECDDVKEARFEIYGCPHTLAVGAWLTQQLGGRQRESLIPGEPSGWASALSVPVEKLGRLLIVEDALRECLRRWTMQARPASDQA